MAKRRPYYGVVGNGETCALISQFGGIEWFCLPKFDGKIVYAKALDPVSGESLDINFSEKDKELLLYKNKQEYIKNTNILKTYLKYKHIDVEITDFMPWKGISESIEDKRFLARLITIKNTSRKTRKISMKILSGIGKVPYKKYRDLNDKDVICEESDFTLVIRILDNLENIKLRSGEKKDLRIVIAYFAQKKSLEKFFSRVGRINVGWELNKVKRFWESWIARGKKISFKNRDYEEIYYRSLLIIKLISYYRTGAILAAPTASFPATPGGTENWDYRFCWARDSFFAAKALLKTGHYEEVKKLLNFFYRVQAKNGHWKCPFYTIEGQEPPDEIVVEELQGPDGEGSIKVSNEARNQLQLDTEGSILNTTYLYYLFTEEKIFLEKYWNNVRGAANWITRNYNREENGLWELREHEHKEREHWTYGKVLCYVGLESAMRIAGILKRSYPKEWRGIRDKIKNDVLKKAWSNQRQAFLQTYDDDAQADVSALAIEDYGLLKPNNKRIERTVNLMEEKLVVGGDGVKRFEDAALPFHLPTLWLAMHNIRTRNLQKARKYIDACINSSTNLYLCAEHFDPVNKMQHGNFPQIFNAAMFIDVLLSLSGTKEYTLTFLNLLNLSAKTFLKFVEKIEPRKGLTYLQTYRKEIMK